jgi:hypothetical protein
MNNRKKITDVGVLMAVKKQYETQLFKIIKRPVYNLFKEKYDEVKENNKQKKNVIKKFQDSITVFMKIL